MQHVTQGVGGKFQPVYDTPRSSGPYLAAAATTKNATCLGIQALQGSNVLIASEQGGQGGGGGGCPEAMGRWVGWQVDQVQGGPAEGGRAGRPPKKPSYL